MPEEKKTKKMRKDAESIFSAGIDAVKARPAVFTHCRMEKTVLRVGDVCLDLKNFKNVFVTGAGKASAHMASAVEELLGGKIDGGVISVKYGHGCSLEKIRIIEAGHPVFDHNSITGAEEIMSVAKSAGHKDLVIFLLSGGASALMAMPALSISPADKQNAVKLLLLCGADIDSINVVRKHISMVKGGRLAEAAYPATVLSIIISDVVGDTIDVIGSGPTVPDKSTYGDCLRIIEKYRLEDSLPESVKTVLEKGAASRVPETPKNGDPAFSKSYSRIIATNGHALEASRKKAESLGYNTVVLSSAIEGDTRAAAHFLSSVAKEVKKSANPAPPPACILSGGETTVQVKGTGRGGRNQEFALASAFEIAGMENTVVLCGGTDGTDGPTDAAGGIVDGKTIYKAEKEKTDAQSSLENNDSHTFLNKTGNLLVTGPTGTNVMDLRIFLVAY